jgi:hypothetical protein
VRWFYDLPGGTSWAIGEPGPGDSLVAVLSGSFDVVVGAGRVRPSQANLGLHLAASVGWTVDDPATNSVGLVISSRPTRPHRFGSERRDEPAGG